MNTGPEFTYARPWDPHTHLRSPAQIGQGAFETLVRLNTIHYAVAIAEPNVALDPKKPHHHIFSAEDVTRYREIVEEARTPDNRCLILYLIKLTDETDPKELDKALALPFVVGVKIYPEGVTTGAQHGGVSDFWGPRLRENFAVVAERKKIVQEHPERPGVTSSKREFEYRGILECHVAQNPRITFFAEHMSDRHTLELVGRYPNLFGTITGHHLRLTEDDALTSSDNFCRPHAKDPLDREALVEAALGLRLKCRGKIISITDSAYHPHWKKHQVTIGELPFHTCAGVFNPAEVAIPDVVALFVESARRMDDMSVLNHLESFTSHNAARAYGIFPHTPGELVLQEGAYRVPPYYDMDGDPNHRGVPFKASQELRFRIVPE